MNLAFLKRTAPVLAIATWALLTGCSDTTSSRDGTTSSGSENLYRGSATPASSSRTPTANQGQANPSPVSGDPAYGVPSRDAPMGSGTMGSSGMSGNRAPGLTSTQESMLTSGNDRAALNSARAGAVLVAEKPDNSAQNEVDRDGRTMTPFDQGSSAADIEITRSIRKELTGDESLSINAQNLKVITNNGVVVLRGPVASAAEADRVIMHTRKVTGVTRVTNQIVMP